MRGYIETKRTLFQSYSRGSEFWRISISGIYEDVTYIKKSLENILGIKVGQVTHRKEREEYGITSQSYRFSTQNRDSVAKIIEYIDDDKDISVYLKDKIKGFDYFNANTPFNLKRKVFKNYRNAVIFLSRELNIIIKGVQGSTGTKGFRPVYLWEGDTQIACFRGWESVYLWASEQYKNETGFKAPEVK